MEKKIFECECGGHLLVGDVWEESGFKSIDLAFFNHGHSTAKPTIRRRIELAFKILTSGTLYNDMVSLSPKEATRLGNFLIENGEK